VVGVDGSRVLVEEQRGDGVLHGHTGLVGGQAQGQLVGTFDVGPVLPGAGDAGF
jgi:hypothetical protein